MCILPMTISFRSLDGRDVRAQFLCSALHLSREIGFKLQAKGNLVVEISGRDVEVDVKHGLSRGASIAREHVVSIR